MSRSAIDHRVTNRSAFAHQREISNGQRALALD